MAGGCYISWRNIHFINYLWLSLYYYRVLVIQSFLNPTKLFQGYLFFSLNYGIALMIESADFSRFYLFVSRRFYGSLIYYWFLCLNYLFYSPSKCFSNHIARFRQA